MHKKVQPLLASHADDSALSDGLYTSIPRPGKAYLTQQGTVAPLRCPETAVKSGTAQGCLLEHCWQCCALHMAALVQAAAGC